MRVWVSAVATAIAIGAVAVSVGGGGSSANRFVATTGTDTGTCSTLVTACLSFGYACSQASAGDTIEIEAGTYAGTQHVTCTPSSTVTFQPASGATVIVDFDTVGNNGCTYDASDNYNATYSGHGRACGLNIDGATNVTFKDIHLKDQWVAFGGASNITMQNIDAERFQLCNFNNITIDGGDYGPYVMSPAPHDSGGSLSGNCGTSTGTGSVTVKNALFHDYQCDATCWGTGAHPPDCITFGGQNGAGTTRAGAVLLANNTFLNCGGYDAWAKNTFASNQQWFTSITFRNNFFGQNYYHWSGSGHGDTTETGIFSDWSGQVIDNVSILYNTFDAPNDGNSTGFAFCTSGCTFSNDFVQGNINPIMYGFSGCGLSGVTEDHNVGVTLNGACSGTDTQNASAMSELTVAGYSSGSENMHLSSDSAIAIDKGGTGCSGLTDIDGTTRYLGTACDAGADERK